LPFAEKVLVQQTTEGGLYLTYEGNQGFPSHSFLFVFVGRFLLEFTLTQILDAILVQTLVASDENRKDNFSNRI